MKNDTFESLVYRPKCSGPKSIGPKYFRAEVVSGAEVFSGRSISGPKYFPGRSIHRAEVVSGRSISGPKCFGPKYFRAEVSVGPKLSLGQTGCEPFVRLLINEHTAILMRNLWEYLYWTNNVAIFSPAFCEGHNHYKAPFGLRLSKCPPI